MNMSLGDIPIMVKSKNCYLANLSGKELVDKQEDCKKFKYKYANHIK